MISSEFFFRCSLKSLHRVEFHGKIILQNLFCTCLALRTRTPGRTRCMYSTVGLFHMFGTVFGVSPPLSSFSLWASIFSQMLTESSHNTASGKSGLSEYLEEGAVTKDSKSSCSNIILQAVFTLQTGQAYYNF